MNNLNQTASSINSDVPTKSKTMPITPTYFLKTTEKREYHFAKQSIQLEVNKDTFPPSQWANLVIDYLSDKIDKGDKLIDIGTGVGIIGIFAAKMGAQIYGTDTSTHAIAQARINANLNNVAAEFEVGPYFVDFEEDFNFITANLPQEIIPNQYPVNGHLLSTIKGGDKGNDILMGLLKEARKYMGKQTKLIVPISSLSYYLETIEYMTEWYNVNLQGVYEVKAKEYVSLYEDYYQGLNDSGYITIFKKNNKWHHLLYIVELQKKGS